MSEKWKIHEKVISPFFLVHSLYGIQNDGLDLTFNEFLARATVGTSLYVLLCQLVI